MKHVAQVHIGLTLLRLCYLVLVVGLASSCERQGQSVDHHGERHEQWLSQRAGGPELIIRVELWEGPRVEVNCAGSGYGFWALPGGEAVLRREAGQGCFVSWREGQWLVQDEYSRNLLSGEAVITNKLPASGQPESGRVARRGLTIPSGPSEITDSHMRKLEIRPDEGGVLSVGVDKPKSYRGRLRCIGGSGDTFRVVNVVELEEYLAGVVGAEMPAWWHQEALQAQSIASRTYALYQMCSQGVGREWDLYSHQGSQVYGGLEWENRRVAEALRQTRGVVLAYGGRGAEKIFPTYYSSTCGGHTEDASAVFRESLAPLAGRRCPYCRGVAESRYYRWGEVSISKTVVSDLLMARYPALSVLEKVVEVKVVGQSDYGRVEKLQLVGANGKRLTIRAEDFRLGVSTKKNSLRSSWYKLVDGGNSWRFVDGRGWGHGVGLCQCGSQQMAKEGKNCVAILEYYYPQALLVRAY